MKYDFGGWATRANLRCSDGRTILKDAFKESDGVTVPLVWNHQHDDPNNVLGHALLENRGDGVYAYCTFNPSEQGKQAKLLVENGDVSALSIYANQLRQNGMNVEHGSIKEVSLVLAGANPGAFIDSVSIAHGEDSDGSAVIYTGEEIDNAGGELTLNHADEKESEMKDDEKKPEEEKGSKTVGDVLATLNEEQKKAVTILLDEALKHSDEPENPETEEEDTEMKHNVFDKETEQQENVLTHSDVKAILDEAKRGQRTLGEVVSDKLEGGVLAHSIDTTGMETATGTQTYGFNDTSMLFPEFRTLNNPPDWIARDMGWVSKVMAGVHRTPFSRIKSVYANITEDEARARGYIKGKQKKEEVFTTLKRTTDPQTIYKKQKLDRDDIIDITDFDVVAWIRAEMRMMLNEEIARAILIGDGRPSDSDDKISEDHVRPIITDKPLFNVKVPITVAANADEETVSKAIINGVIRARKNYKGSGNPTFFTTEDVLTELLLLEDGIGHKMYKTEAELATALRVKEIVTVEPMEGYKLNNGEVSMTEGDDLVGVVVNLTDYNVGADKGGEINMFDDFDIDFNQYKYLIETRISGALIKPFSALTVTLKRSA